MDDRDDAQFRPPAEGVMRAARPRRRGGAAALLLVLLIAPALSSPAWSHKGEKHERVQQARQAPPSGAPPAADGVAGPAPRPGGMMDDMDMDMDRDRSGLSFLERLSSFVGRLHPLIVHFPIAFFPAALFTAIVGRRRPAFSAPVQFLVVAGGIFAPVAALAGWFAGMDADPEPVLAYHRWLGVTIGLLGAGLGVWAWRRPWEDRGAGMILALTIMTVAIAVQGFLGAVLTHGMDHLMF